MNNTLQSFSFDSHGVRVIEKDGEPWFVARDICSALDISNVSDALTRLDDDERGDIGLNDVTGRNQEFSIISESGLYSLILGSRKPEAKAFKKWVTSEVLPSIRKTGQYSAVGSSDAKMDKLLGLMEQMLRVMPQMLEAANPQKAKRERRRMHEEDVARIMELRAEGYLLHDLVIETEFSQSQCWAVCAGRYKVLESGRVSIDLRNDVARAAADAAKEERRANEAAPGEGAA